VSAASRIATGAAAVLGVSLFVGGGLITPGVAA
jgi:hypothetical protein